MISRFRQLAWTSLFFTIFVTLWGAYVRASGSGAGCGRHWPLCNGEIVPRSAAFETLVEFSHRATSGMALVLVVLLYVVARKKYSRTHPCRKSAALALGLMVIEALIGAGLVLFELVGQNASLTRAFVMGIHLVNSMLLLGALGGAAWYSSADKEHVTGAWNRTCTLLALAGFGILLVSASGALTALGDTIFKSESLIEGIRADFSPTSHFLVRLRVWHPVLAVLIGTYVMMVSFSRRSQFTSRRGALCITALGGLVAVQLLIGFINLVLLAPITVQLLHLAVAESIWLLLVFSLLEARALAYSNKVKTPTNLAAPTPELEQLAQSEQIY